MYKNLLQQYAQKQNLDFPVYTSEAEGPPHARRFKSRVCLDGKSYETFEFFPTLKEAEQAAAKVACQVLSVDVVQENAGLYTNLLQEFAHKNGLLCPLYETVSSGLSHRLVFVSKVEIGSDTFLGAEAKTKKLAEINAAKVAYCALTRVKKLIIHLMLILAESLEVLFIYSRFVYVLK
ncbi:double-stranded RNA-binding protein 4-like [Sesamum indicum]|uniref:Double-stranded RNA-binding protein 4-like n=1 Tax=Sesamum indicum TaxID=4182 RepID=A0A8M8UQ59_SESIN|nr:double-stranded RNA-binding protein 4-like [Sesamum indicum]